MRAKGHVLWLTVQALAAVWSGQSSGQEPDTNAPPEFSQTSYEFNVIIDELSWCGSIDATDPNGDEVFYSGGDSQEGFSVDSSGMVTFSGSAEEYDSFSFSATADDGRGGTDVCAITVNVLPSSPPVFDQSSYTYNVPEDEFGSLIGNVFAYDPNGHQVWYSGGGAGGMFSVESTTGEIMVSGQAQSGESFTFSVTAHDPYGSTQTNVTVNVTEPINPAPQIVSFGLRYLGYETYVAEGVVDDNELAGCWIEFGGLMEGWSCQVESDGTFSCPMMFGDSEEGLVSAVAYDSSWRASDPAYDWKLPR